MIQDVKLILAVLVLCDWCSLEEAEYLEKQGVLSLTGGTLAEMVQRLEEYRFGSHIAPLAEIDETDHDEAI
jgi:hypothetical protein